MKWQLNVYISQVCLILDYLYDVPCKIIHAPALERNGKLHHSLFEHVDDVKNHFKKFGSPVMMGGDVDASSKGSISNLWIKSVTILSTNWDWYLKNLMLLVV